MEDTYRVLADAISDVGYWRWWAQDLPKLFQVEFGGVQLWTPPTDEAKPPSGVFALRFIKPSLVAFLTDARAGELGPDWPREMQADRMDPVSINHDQFTLTADEQIAALVKGCVPQFLVGDASQLSAGNDRVRLGFRAGPVGLVVRAERLVVLSAVGELAPEKIVEASTSWWQYWRDYWRRKNTDSPLPEDYACEVTIPLQNE